MTCAGLERNSYDGEKCVDFFETYKQCKKREVMSSQSLVRSHKACALLTSLLDGWQMVDSRQHTASKEQKSCKIDGSASVLYASAQLRNACC